MDFEELQGYSFVSGMVLAVIVILILMSIGLIGVGFICDSQNCSIFKQTANIPEQDNQRLNAVLNKAGEEGIWPFAMLAAVIIATAAMWILGFDIEIRAFTIIFLIAFIAIYGVFNFYVHHYLLPIFVYTKTQVNK